MWEYLMSFAAALTSCGLCVWAVGMVIRRLILDLPNERSSHSVPTPRGGGLGMIPAILITWLLFVPDPPVELLAGAFLLMAGSWIDDRRGLSPLVRLVGQMLMALWVIMALPLPGWVLLPLLLAYVWFINLYNFMDGIDGITGVETACLGLGMAVVSPDLAIPGLILAGASVGFLVWNWHPAKVFLGDSGSVPLGLLTGGLLIKLALAGQWAAALILPAYYAADATITLIRRLLNGEKIWQAHRKHFYQRANRGGAGPRLVSGSILLANLALIGCAFLTTQGQTILGLGLATGIVAGLLGLLGWWGRNAPP